MASSVNREATQNEAAEVLDPKLRSVTAMVPI
jgi:hypothetical protein